MLADYPVCAMVATHDLARAREFYEEMLGFTGEPVPAGASVVYRCGAGTWFFLYETSVALPPAPTVATFTVSDVRGLADELGRRGVHFETYDLPGTTRDGPVHTTEGLGSAVWFRDLDGNILSAIEMA